MSSELSRNVEFRRIVVRTNEQNGLAPLKVTVKPHCLVRDIASNAYCLLLVGLLLPITSRLITSRPVTSRPITGWIYHRMSDSKVTHIYEAQFRMRAERSCSINEFLLFFPSQTNSRRNCLPDDRRRRRISIVGLETKMDAFIVFSRRK